MAFTPKVKVHLYETAHSGFYGDARSAETVNLLPKTWTKYTVTDGEWKTEKTIEPLVKRDIYLANMIDAVDYDKRHHYEASSHFIIDHENKVMSVNPFDTMFQFENGLIYNPDNYTIKTDTPPKLGGLDNKLFFKQGEGLTYNAKFPTSSRYDLPEDFRVPDPEFHFEAKINDEDFTQELYDANMGEATIIICNDGLDFDDRIVSGEWHCSSANYWDRLEEKRVLATACVYGYQDDNARSAEYIRDYGTTTGENVPCFNPNDRTPTNTANQQINAGSNFISGDMDMVPVNTLYIW